MEEDPIFGKECNEEVRARIQAFDRPFELTVDIGCSIFSTEPQDDSALVERIIAAYRKAQVFVEDRGSFWSGNFGGRKEPVHAALLRGNVAEVASMLRNPASNDLLYGFDHPCVSWWAPWAIDTSGWQGRSLYDRLVRLGEAIGALHCYHPETPLALQPPPLSLDEVFKAIDTKLAARVEFPTPYANEIGAITRRGLITQRPIQALFQASLLRKSMDGFQRRRVVEIGAGLGRTAYYAIVLGCTNYTIVDLPMSGVAQAYFLGRTIGAENVSLFGESEGAKVKIIPPGEFFDSGDRYDIALNVDSITELTFDVVNKYLDALSNRTPRMISINHECGGLAREVYESRPDWKVDRNPYWMRKGYVQQNIVFQS